MDQQMVQALMGVFQQGLQILQQAQTGGSAPPGPMGAASGAPPMGQPLMGGGAPPMDDGMDEDDDEDMYDADDGDDMDDDAAGDDDGMGGGASLHDRVSQLEGHTGLKKSARGSLSDRLDALESQLLGQEYEGPMVDRVAQLEKAAGLGYPGDDGAPDEIPLDSLIKSAIQQGIQKGMAELVQADEIPDVRSMRKSARDARYGQRRGQRTITTDAELVKAAASQFGWNDDELDEPVTLGDALMMQYHAQQGGEPLPYDPGDDDD
jgi:hypothetical protein